MKVWEWIKANPVKLTGWLTTVVATLQASAARNVIFSENGFEIFVLCVGLFVSFIGMFNTGQATVQAAANRVAEEVRKQGGFARVWMLVILAAVGAIAACGTLGDRFNPVQVAAETGKPELVLLALDGSYTIVQGQALAYAQQPAVPQAVKNCIAGLAEAADPVIDELRPAAREVERLRGELLAAGDDQARAAVVLGNLNKAITDAYGLSERVSPKITALTNAAKGECS